MKWIAILLWAGLCPVVMTYLRQRPAHVAWAAFGMGLLPFVTGTLHLYVAPIAWPQWAGWPKGIEVSALDFLAIAIIGATRSPPSKLRPLVPWLVYLAAVVIALPHAEVKMAGYFYVWQLLRMILIASAAIRLAAYAGAVDSLFKGIFAGVCFQAAFAIEQAIGGATQAGGSFGAQNLLGIMTHFALFPSFAMLLAGKRGFWPVAGFIASVIVDVLTASRATLGLAAMGFAVLAALSILKSSSGRKVALTGLGVLIAAALTPFALQSIQARQTVNSVESSDTQRAAMKDAAWMIIQDYPLGTGPDQYVVIANVGGYAARAGIAWQPGMRGTAVHNSYLLVLAETGLFGLITMLIVLLSPILAAFRAAFRFRRDPQSELLLGVAVAGSVLVVHLFYEWAFILFLFQYTFAMVTAAAVGLVAHLTTRARRERRQRSLKDVELPVLSPAK